MKKQKDSGTYTLPVLIKLLPSKQRLACYGKDSSIRYMHLDNDPTKRKHAKLHVLALKKHVQTNGNIDTIVHTFVTGIETRFKTQGCSKISKVPF